MKKTILSLIALLSIGLVMQAQTKATVPVKSSKAATGKMAVATTSTDKKVSSATEPVKKETAASKTKTTTAVNTKAVAATTATGPVKKDGTPDMRFKANKEKATGPVKKDGTPDKRYKANKVKN